MDACNIIIMQINNINSERGQQPTSYTIGNILRRDTLRLYTLYIRYSNKEIALTLVSTDYSTVRAE